MRRMSLLLCHLNLIASALPCMSSVMISSFGATSEWFIMKATPVEDLRFSGRLEFIMVRCFPKQSLTDRSWVSSR